MATKEELLSIVEEQNNRIEELTALSPEPSDPSPLSRKVTLRWSGTVDLSTGLAPTAYGIRLQYGSDIWFAEMTEERAEVELSRKGANVFVSKNEPVED